MFGKLMKYEIKSIARTMLPLLGAVLGISVLFGFAARNESNNNIFFVITISIFVLLIIAAYMACFFVSVLRFKNNLFTREAYSTLTLPVSSGSHIAVKLLTALLWLLITSIIVAFSVGISVSIIDVKMISEGFKAFGDYITRTYQGNIASLLYDYGIAIASLGAGVIALITRIYASIAIGHRFTKHPLLASIIAYLIFEIILTVVSSMLNIGLFSSIYTSVKWVDILTPSIGINVVQTIAYIVITYIIMRFYLNLE